MVFMTTFTKWTGPQQPEVKSRKVLWIHDATTVAHFRLSLKCLQYDGLGIVGGYGKKVHFKRVIIIKSK